MIRIRFFGERAIRGLWSERMTARKRILPAPPKPARIRHKRGGQPGNANALKHGGFTQDRLDFYAAVRAHIRRGRALVQGWQQKPATHGREVMR